MKDMDEKNEQAGDKTDSGSGTTPGRDGGVAPSGERDSGKPMPSQPREYSPKPAAPETAKPNAAEAAKEKPVSRAETAADPSASKSPSKPAVASSAVPKTQNPDAPRGAKGETPGRSPAGNIDRTAVKMPAVGGSVSALRPGNKTSSTARGEGSGGDTIRMRAAAGPSSSGPGLRSSKQKLPDIRRRQTSSRSSIPSYGPFSLIFGFLWLLFKMIFFTILVMGLAAAIGYTVLTWFIRTPEVVVPNVRGMKVSEAFEVLSDKNLGMVKTRSESSGLVAPGEIIEQSPPDGSKTKKGRAIGVVVSSGRSRFTVPNVLNESIENARNKIRGAGLEVGNELRIEDPTVPKESVISQTPSGNTGLDEPVKVDLLISTGPPGKSLTMPDVTNRPVAEAKAMLGRLGVTDITTDPPDAGPDKSVIDQEPLVGKSIFQADKVTLKVR